MTIERLIGSMFHKDGHTGPGGLFAPEGPLRSVYEAASVQIGGGDPLAFIEASMSSREFPCSDLNKLYHGQNPRLDDDFLAYMADALRDEVGGDSWENWEQFVAGEYIECLENAAAPFYDDFGG